MKIKKNLVKKFKPIKKPAQREKSEKKPEIKSEKRLEEEVLEEDFEDTAPIFENHFESFPSLTPEDLILSSGEALQQNLETTASTAAEKAEDKTEQNLIKYESFEGLYSDRKNDNRNQDRERAFEIQSRNLEVFEARMPTTHIPGSERRMSMIRQSELMDIEQDEKYEIQDIHAKKEDKMPWQQEQDARIKKYNSRE